MSLDIEAFSENVRQYCQWVESSEHDLQSARQLLLVLLQAIPYLTVPDATDKPEQDYPSRDHAKWESDHNRLADLPLQYYREVFAPCDLDEEPPVTADLRDDLADIYGELWHGLQALNSGDVPTLFSIGRTPISNIGDTMHPQPFTPWTYIIETLGMPNQTPWVR